jgi:hypothetical protein
MGWKTERSKFFHIIQTGFQTHPSFLSNGYWGHFPQGYSSWDMKVTTHLPTSAEVKKTWIYISTPPYAFMA